MLKSIYTPLSGALAQEKVLSIIANNLANAQTVGFKEESVGFKLLQPEPYKHYKDPLPPANYKINFEDVLPLRGNDHAYVGISGVHRDDSQGPVIQTGNPLDLMLEGKGYFVVNTPDGERLTRNGTFTLNQDGLLADRFGHPVIGENGTLFLRNDDFTINHLGEVMQDGQILDRLKIVEAKNQTDLEKIGLNLYLYNGKDADLAQVPYPSIKQGSLEGSNVNAIRNLTNMILAHRSYEAYQKAIQNYDTIMEQSSNTLGTVRA